jgi:hypothetical protein
LDRGGVGVSHQLGLACFVGYAWAMWNTRNKMCIQKVFPSKPVDIIYCGMSFVQKWSLLMRKPEKEKVDALKSLLIRRIQDFKPLESNPSDIGFI